MRRRARARAATPGRTSAKRSGTQRACAHARGRSEGVRGRGPRPRACDQPDRLGEPIEDGARPRPARTREPGRGAKVEAICGERCVEPDEKWARREIADALLAEIRKNVTDGQHDEEARAIGAILRRCQREAEALAGAALEARARPGTLQTLFARLERLRRTLGDGRWKVAARRISALAQVRDETWDALESVPCWAVARALGAEHACDTEYARGIDTLASSLGAWAAPHARAAAERGRVALGGRPDPSRIEALLRTWPWAVAMPPLPAAAACAEAGRTNLSEDEWAAALTLESLDGPVGAEALAHEIEGLGPQLRDTVEETIEREACEQLARLFVERWGNDPSPSERRAVLQRMRALWARNKHLAPKDPADHALRVVPTGGHELITPSLSWLPRSLEGAVHSPPSLAWRVPYTDAARALAATNADLADEASAQRAGSFCTSHARRCVKVGRVPGWEADYEGYRDRARSIETILERLASEFARARGRDGNTGCGEAGT